MGNVGHRACCCGCLRDLCRTDLQSNEEAAQQKNAGRRRGGGICRCNSGSSSDCADTDAPLKIFNPSAAWSTTRRSLPTQFVIGEYIGCQKTHAFKRRKHEFFSVPVWTAADVVGFLPAIPLNVSFFKEQGECCEAACAERQPKHGGKIIARFGVVRRAWGCGRHGSRYGCGSCRRCRRWFRCGRGRWFRCGRGRRFRCGRGRRFCGWGCRWLRCRRGCRFRSRRCCGFRSRRCGGICSRRCCGFNGRCCRRLRGRGQLGRGDGEGGIQPVSVACQIQVLDGCTGRRRVLYGACYGCYFIISRF